MTDTAVAPRQRKAELVAGASISAIIPRSIEEVFRVAQAVVTAGLAPDSYTKERGMELPPDKMISRVVIGIMKGAECGLPPINALSTIAIINNRPCLWGDGATALIQASGLLEKMTIREVGTPPGASTEVAKYADDFGVEVSMFRRGQDEPYTYKFTVGMAKRAHLWMNPKRVPWCEHPERQMKWRAFSWAARDGFSDVLMGLHIREEVEDLPGDPTPTDTSFLDDMPIVRHDAQPAIEHQPAETVNVSVSEETKPVALLVPQGEGGADWNQWQEEAEKIVGQCTSNTFLKEWVDVNKAALANFAVYSPTAHRSLANMIDGVLAENSRSAA